VLFQRCNLFQARIRCQISSESQTKFYLAELNRLVKEKTLKKGLATKQQAAVCNPIYKKIPISCDLGSK